MTLRGGTGEGGKFRIVGLDAPEKTQDPEVDRRGTAAIRKLLNGRRVEVQDIPLKSHGREAGRLFVDGVNVGVEMIRQGNGLAIRKSRTPGFNSQTNPAAYFAERIARAKAVADRKAGKELTVEEHGLWARPEAHQRLQERAEMHAGVQVHDLIRNLFGGVTPKYEIDADPIGMSDLFDDATVGTIRKYNPEEGTVLLVTPGGKSKTMLLTDLAGGLGLLQLLPGYETPREFDDKRRGR